MGAEDIEQRLAADLQFWSVRYDSGVTWPLKPTDRKTYLGARAPPRVCRYCGQHEPEATFRKEAHALPAFFGNRTLLVNYECDACNQLFGNTLENQLGNWSKPLRTVLQTKGRRGVPELKSVDGRWTAYIDGGVLHLDHGADDPDFVLDEEQKTLTLRLPKDPYTPLQVLKALVRIGIQLLPEEKVQLFDRTIAWVRDVLGTVPFYSRQTAAIQFVPGPAITDQVVASLFFRTNDYAPVPFCQLMLAFGNAVLHVGVPCPAKDWLLSGKSIAMPWFPIQDAEHVRLYGQANRSNLDLSSSEIVRGSSFEMTLQYDDRIKVDSFQGRDTA